MNGQGPVPEPAASHLVPSNTDTATETKGRTSQLLSIRHKAPPSKHYDEQSQRLGLSLSLWTGTSIPHDTAHTHP